ncbi:MAG: response regulator [Gammaproteobacteria bacterium]
MNSAGQSAPKRAGIVAAILALMLLPLAAMVVFAIFTAREALEHEILQTATADSRGAALVVAGDIASKKVALALFSTRILVQEAMARRDWAGMERHLRDLTGAITDFERAFITDPAGTLRTDYPHIDPAVIGRNFSEREWYQGVVKSQEPYLSGTYERAAKPVRLVHALAALVFGPEGQLAGFMVVQDAGTKLREKLEQFAAAKVGGIALVDHNGRRVFEVGAQFLPERTDVRAGHPCIAKALKGEESTAILADSNRDFAVVCTPVLETGWAIAAHLPVAKILTPLRDIAWRMGGAGLALLLIAGYLAGHWARTFSRNRELLAETQRLRREAETQRNRYWSLLDSSADGLAMADSNKILLHVNGTFARLLGLNGIEALIGRPVAEFREHVFPLLAEPEKYAREMERLWREPEATGDFEMALKDGRVFHFYSRPVHDKAGALTGRSLACRDVTRAREVDRMKSEFVATVSHELRTPLASLLGFSELMLTRALPEEKQHQFLEVIHKESKRLNALINDFLDLQRIESGRVSYAFQPLDAGALIREVAALYANHVRHPLRLELPDGLPPVSADHDRLKQVLQNLLSNAVKFSPQGGEIVISARAAGAGAVEIAVRDHGLGIPEEALPRLFSKFYRVDTTDRREIGGTGLGLALCKEIVEAHRGRIWAESRAGEGSVFRFTLPAAGVSAAPAAPASGADVLLVEDDDAFATLVREHLAEAGWSVRVEATAETALEALHASPPRLILLDIHLAGKMDGWDFLVTVKGDPRLASIPVVITTITEKREKGIALGASDYLVKPFPMERLIASIRRHLSAPEGARVLVVDDDASFRTALAETLRAELRCVVDEAANGTEALTKIGARAPQLVVLDLLMPGMDGFAVLDTLRARADTAALPVLVVTAKDLTPQDKEHLRHGMARVLTKAEYSRERLVALIRTLIGGGGAGTAPV